MPSAGRFELFLPGDSQGEEETQDGRVQWEGVLRPASSNPLKRGKIKAGQAALCLFSVSRFQGGKYLLTQRNHTKALPPFHSYHHNHHHHQVTCSGSYLEVRGLETLIFALCPQEGLDSEHPQLLVWTPLWFITHRGQCGVSVRISSVGS